LEKLEVDGEIIDYLAKLPAAVREGVAVPHRQLDNPAFLERGLLGHDGSESLTY